MWILNFVSQNVLTLNFSRSSCHKKDFSRNLNPRTFVETITDPAKELIFQEIR